MGQEPSRERATTGQQKQGRERDPRVSQSEGPGEGDSSATKRERRPEAGSEKKDDGVVGEVVEDDQEGG